MEIIYTAEERNSQERHKLEKLGADNDVLLFSTKTVFPFQFFPTTLTVEKTKVNINKSLFIASNQIISILISEISSVEADTTLFFGTLRISSKLPGAAPLEVPFLRKSDAMKARRIIQGLAVSLTNKVDVTKIPNEQLVDGVEKLGATKVSASY
jgi:hypothetical protein